MRLDAEANLQAEFYHACRLIELPCVLEVHTPAGRIDAAILNKARTHLLAVIEVKRDRSAFMDGRSQQIQSYKQLGLPVYGLAQGDDPHRLARSIAAATATAPGKTIREIMGMGHIRETRLKGKRERRIARLRENLCIRP